MGKLVTTRLIVIDHLYEVKLLVILTRESRPTVKLLDNLAWPTGSLKTVALRIDLAGHCVPYAGTKARKAMMVTEHSSPRASSPTPDDYLMRTSNFGTIRPSLEFNGKQDLSLRSETGTDRSPMLSSNGAEKSLANSAPSPLPEFYSTDKPHSRPQAAPRYSEIYSPAPELVPQQEKEALYQYQDLGAVGPGAVVNTKGKEDVPRKWYKRKRYAISILAAVVLILIAVILGAVLGTRKHDKKDHADTVTPSTSESGAFNGSGIAIASTNGGLSDSVYAFYQDFTGSIQYRIMDDSGSWRTIGPVNDGGFPALNGTPISAVHYIRDSDESRMWHIFFIDQDYILRERILKSDSGEISTPYWIDGPIGDQNLKAVEDDSVGMQACYWGNYYGEDSDNSTDPEVGIHIWFANSPTSFKQYSWTSSADDWEFDRTWDDLNGYAGVGCQTWETNTTEYVFFVGPTNELDVYWKDANTSTTASSQHPIDEWARLAPEQLSVTDLHPLSSLGYTNYIAYQAADATIRGLRVIWDAENTRPAESQGTVNTPDDWTLRDVQTGDPVVAVGGTHLSITSLGTASGGSRVAMFLQATGDDVSVYTRDMADSDSLWQTAQQVI